MQRCKRMGLFFGAAVVAMAFFSAASTAMAAGLFAPTGGGASNEPTEIVSDRLVNNNTEKVAEFTGAVKATQGNFSITADTLRIHYQGDLINPPKDTSAKSQVTKMVAIGRDGKSFAESSGSSRVKAVLHQGPKEGEGPKADKPAEKKQ